MSATFLSFSIKNCRPWKMAISFADRSIHQSTQSQPIYTNSIISVNELTKRRWINQIQVNVRVNKQFNSRTSFRGNVCWSTECIFPFCFGESQCYVLVNRISSKQRFSTYIRLLKYLIWLGKYHVLSISVSLTLFLTLFLFLSFFPPFPGSLLNISSFNLCMDSRETQYL